MVSSIPKGCNTVSAYLVLKDVKKALEFYSRAFGSTGETCLEGPDGSVMHAEMRLGNSTIMLSQENPQWNCISAETMGGSPVSMHVYVDDCDALFKQAIKAGCVEVAPMMDAFWGDRFGKVADPFGYTWGLATHKEDLTPEELRKRGQEWMAQMAEQNG